MKRIIGIILCLTFIIFMPSCRMKKVVTPTTTIATTEPKEVTVITVTEKTSSVEKTKIESTKTAEKTTVITAPQINSDTLFLLAHLMYAEYSNSTDVVTQQYVGSVALNRVKSDHFPDSLYTVIYQKGQYSCTWDGNFEKEPDAKTWENARELMISGSILPENVVYQAQFPQGSGVYCCRNGEYFCYY